MKKMSMMFATMLIIGIFASVVSAESDSTGDLFHHTLDTSSVTGWSFEQYSGEKPNIDITDLSYDISGSEVTITLTVAGVIEDKEGLAYYVYIPHDTVMMGGLAYYTNGFYYEWGDSQASANSEMTSYAGTDTLTFVIDYENPEDISDVWGYTYEVSDITELTNGEYWGDWAPDTYFPAYDSYYGDTSDEDSGDQGTDGEDDTNGSETNGEQNQDDTNNGDNQQATPGFEMILVLASIAIGLFIFKKHK